MGIVEMVLDRAYRQGFNEGMEIGLQLAEEESVKKELEKGIKPAIEMAKIEFIKKSLLKGAISVKDIAYLSNKTVAFVVKISKGLK